MDSLKIDLFQPGMTPLLRAGLGGLACTLRWIEETEEPIAKPPGTWRVDDRSIELKWEGGSEGAGAFFEALYTLAFGIHDDLIYLPGSYGSTAPSPNIRAELQQGMSQTILQFGPNRKAKSKVPVVKSYPIDDHVMTIQHQAIIDYTHRSAWRDLVTSKGTLRPFAAVGGTIGPGFAQRHVAHPSSVIELPSGLAIAAHFALVGTLSLPIDRGSGVLVAPDVQDLEKFIDQRQHLNPKDPRSCQINSPADAALQAQIRLRAAAVGKSSRVDRCVAILFDTKAWNSKQKTRAGVIDIAMNDRGLVLFDKVMRIEELKPRPVLAKGEKKGDPPRPFWAKGVVRPFIAENLARGRPWFEDFRRLVVGADWRTDEKRIRELGYERKGLSKMIAGPWEDQGEEAFVRSIHEAMSRCFRKIAADARDAGVDTFKRWDKQLQRWRIELAQAKTPDDVRKVVAAIWGRARTVPTLVQSWRLLLPILCDERRWQLNRDLALLALTSHELPKKKIEPEAPPTPKA